MSGQGGRKVVILQPSYIPWRGYFHQIYKADVFVFYDCVQYDKHGWRNRNRIRSTNGTQWLTIPVISKGCVAGGTLIKDVFTAPKSNWRSKHLRTLQTNYSRAMYFSQYEKLLEEIYSCPDDGLSNFTCSAVELLSREIGITGTEFVRSSTLGAFGAKTERLINILRLVGATHYISGPSARGYLDENALRKEGISLEYMSYDYREYPQCFAGFDSRVSILDLLFNVGERSSDFIWG